LAAWAAARRGAAAARARDARYVEIVFADAAHAAACVAALAADAADAAAVARAAASTAAAFAAAADRAAAWEEIRADVMAIQDCGANVLADLQLWPRGSPTWADAEWNDLKTALPRDEGWDVWIEWYENRLRGGSRGEAYELVFAKVPLDVWGKGRAAANGWIRQHLP